MSESDSYEVRSDGESWGSCGGDGGIEVDVWMRDHELHGTQALY